MQDSSQSDRSMYRRTALAGGTALLAGGSLLAWVGQPATAAITLDSFDVSDAEFSAEEVRPVVDVTAQYRYDAGNSAVANLRFALAVDGTVIASDELTTDRTVFEGTTKLSGSLLESDGLDAENFQPDVADSVSQEVTVELRFEVLDAADEAIVENSATDTATIVVSHPQKSRYVAAVGGTGVVRTPE